jgi:uncharacterized protein YuzB (UPF0349 family)
MQTTCICTWCILLDWTLMQGESICGKCNMQLMNKINNFIPMFGLTFKYILIVGKL